MTDAGALSAGKRLLLEKLLRGEGPRRAKGVNRRPDGADAPLTPEQTHVWLHGAMAPDLPLYNEPITVHRRGPFDHEAFEAAFNELLRRHEMWRSVVVQVDGEPVLRALPELHVRLPLVDLTGLPAAERWAEAVRQASADARVPVDPAAAPLMWPRLVKLAEDDHRLFLTLHHLIFDGVTLNRVLLPELSAIYEAYAQARPHGLPEPELQFADYAAWRAEQGESPRTAEHLEYWRRRLADPPLLELAGDRPRPPAPSHRGGMEVFELSPALTEALRNLSRREGATLYAVLLAGFKALLHRYTGQDDLVVGSVTDTRSRPELQALAGYFLNTVALRTRPGPELSFRAYLGQVRETAFGAMTAAEVPFDRVVRELAPDRDPGRHPLFQAMFSMQPQAPTIPGWDLTQMDVGTDSAKFDLFLEVEERPDTVAGRFVYSADLFEAPTIRRMIGALTVLLEAVATDPARRLGDLPLMRPEEQRLVLETWGSNPHFFPTSTIHGWFEAQARVTPEAPALEFEDGETWTYRRLDARADRLAARLQRVGVGPGQLVAVCLERSLDMVAALLAVLKTGAAYLPLDPAFPPQRLAMLIEDAGACSALTQKSLAGKLPGRDLTLVLVDEPGEARARPAPAPITPEAPAYVMFTSGSTGKPKAVEIPHRAVVNLLHSLRIQPGFGPADSMLVLAPLTFDASVDEIFLPLVSGGRAVVASRETAVDPARLGALIDAVGVTTMFATPVTWRGLLDQGWKGGGRLRILCGGEAMPREHFERLKACCGELWHVYGPTETTVYALMHRVDEIEDGAVPIGGPLANVLAYVLDANGRPAPVGAPGELYIGGAGVGLRYRNREDLTAERFVELAVAPGEKLYRTGDMVRWRADGTIEYLGRRDGQVKVRGFRIELGEVEAALEACPEVGAAAVRTWPDASGALTLAAYVVGRAGGPAPEPAVLRRRLREALPEYMTPAHFMVLRALPTTTSGKVDRNALPEPAPAVETGFEEPRGDLELRLAAIWREVLGVARVGAHDNFFDLGGHSILVAKLLRRIEVEFGRRLSAPDVFRAPDVRRMSALLDGSAPRTRPTLANEIQPRGSRPPLFWLNGGALFWPLAEALGTDQPFLGVRRDTAEPLPEDFSLADLAPQMIRIVRELQPEGPYHLGGWCAWGVLAYEAAQQLKAQGEKVGLVVMMDPPQPDERRAVGGLALEASKLKLHVTQFMRRSGRARWAYLRERVDGAFGRLQETFDPAEVGEQSRFGGTIGRACLRYEPKPYDGDVALFVPLERPDVLDPAAAWAPLVRGRFSADELPGDHWSVLKRPRVQALATALAARLRGETP
jgi:amino acid adenylation domain-containing protein